MMIEAEVGAEIGGVIVVSAIALTIDTEEVAA